MNDILQLLCNIRCLGFTSQRWIMTKFSKSRYTAKNSRITESEKTENITVTAILDNSYKQQQEYVYTAKVAGYTLSAKRYIHG